MSRTRQKMKGRTETGTFVALPHQCLDHPNYCQLSAYAKVLLLDLCRQYNGFNNGKLKATFNYLQPRGWKSRDTLNKALRALESSGWIVKTRQGGKNLACYYAVTFRNIDECFGEVGIRTAPTALNWWRSGKPN